MYPAFPDIQQFFKNKHGHGYLLSLDEAELLRNLAQSLNDVEDIGFLHFLAEKEYITESEKDSLWQIFIEATDRIRRNSSREANFS
ncbi:MAG: hypothetical protein PQJ50_06590 [Spirochaetales bacterium]|nr:hypothetical protein [Spirochaetales bacterium]